MQRKYGNQGFAAVSVSLDDPKDPKDRELAESFLKKQKATFLNVLLDSDPDEWGTKLKVNGPPCVYVFDRANQFILKTSDEENFGAIEKAVQQLLAK